jgi:hypothetical protein
MDNREPKPKSKKPRLRSMKAMLAETITELTVISQDATQKPAKRSDAVMTKATLLQSLYQTQSEEARARLKHADVDALTKEVERLRAENAELRARQAVPIVRPDREETFEEKLFRLTGKKEELCIQA